MKDDRVYLRHILECAQAIGGYVTQGRPLFLEDRRTQKAVLRELQELSESAQRLSPDLQARHPEVPWTAIAGFRNVLVHDYLGDQPFPRMGRDRAGSPRLRTTVATMLQELGEDPPTC